MLIVKNADSYIIFSSRSLSASNLPESASSSPSMISHCRSLAGTNSSDRVRAGDTS
ncbi:uncharacterized protein METZ01_LOCUS291328, partial [marine metagenome]